MAFEIEVGDSLEITADDGKFFNLEIMCDGSLEVYALGSSIERRHGDEFTQDATVKFTPEQAPDVLLAVQNWIAQL